ncbi:MAG: phosphotransferase [Bdellovibrionota bacterium]
MNTLGLKHIKQLYQRHFQAEPTDISELGAHASKRSMLRLSSSNQASCIGVYNENSKENLAFINFGKTFKTLNLPVPEIIAQDLDSNVYLQQDLGEQTLWDILSTLRSDTNPFPVAVQELYKQALSFLVKFQIEGGKAIDYSNCVLHQEYSRDSMLADMRYFAQEFLERHEVKYSKSELEKNFQVLSELLLTAPIKHFCYRDFQSRNIMLHEDQLYFIDFQGGRKGAVHWDLVSLLYQSSANIPENIRQQLYLHYLTELKEFENIDEAEFRSQYSGFILIRMLQVLGTYGKHGLGAGKEYFLNSIPHALKNIQEMALTGSFPKGLTELEKVLKELSETYGDVFDA